MGRKKITRADRVNQAFGEAYRIGKARADLTNLEIASIVGLKTQATLKKRRDNPMDLTLGELFNMGAAFRWTEDDYMNILRAGIK